MTSISEAYKRWRHSRGYGVHSPFAYSLVKGVVRPGRGYAWYGYSRTDRAARGCRLPDVAWQARMLLRLASFLGVKKAFIPNADNTAPYRTALLAADSRMVITSALAEADSCTLICTARDLVPLEALTEFLQQPGRCVAMRSYPAGWEKRLFDSLGEGLMLYSRENLIVISRSSMQKVAYTISL